MKRAIAILLLLTLTTATVSSLAAAYKYRIWLSDKQVSEYSTSLPEEFLSQACLERRSRQGVGIDSRDLPVCRQYINQIEALGCTSVVTSRWMNTVVVALDDTALVAEIAKLPFVEKTECVWKENNSPAQANKLRRERQLKSSTASTDNNNASTYGDAWQPIDMLHADKLHDAGFRGEGMTIAVLDAGFYGVENSTYFDQEKITFLHAFPHKSLTYGGETHGTEVLSCMAANKSGSYVGSAPDAQYILIVTEDIDSEYPIEEDYWVAGVELADSIGADIINTSLAYNTFDDSTMDYTHNDLDGKTAFSSRAANIAFQKELLIVVAAGNEYRGVWKKIAVPSDAEGVITVGSVTSDGTHSPFSSCGYTADDRIKPDAVAMGSSVNTITAGDVIKRTSGTSYATPILCGAIACLWQSQPQWSAKQLIEALQKSSSQHDTPDALCGYGIPDIYAAYKNNSGTIANTPNDNTLRYHNGTLLLPYSTEASTLTLYDTTGRLVLQQEIQPECTTIDLQTIERGLYIAVWQSAHDNKALKIKR